jgi:hypothetical protein
MYTVFSHGAAAAAQPDCFPPVPFHFGILPCLVVLGFYSHVFLAIEVARLPRLHFRNQGPLPGGAMAASGTGVLRLPQLWLRLALVW